MNHCGRSLFSVRLCSNRLHHKLAFIPQPSSSEDAFLLKEKYILQGTSILIHALHYHSALPEDREAQALALRGSRLLSVDVQCVFRHLTKEKDAVGQPFFRQCKVLEVTLQRREYYELWHSLMNCSAG